MRVSGFLGLALAGVLLLGLSGPAARARDKGDKLPRLKRSAEFDYVDETNDEEAARKLPDLLKKYDTPQKCAKLLEILRTKRSHPSRMPGRMTLEHRCSDGKTRQFTYILPSRYNRRKQTGLLVFLHGAVRQPPPGGGAHEAAMFGAAVKPLNLIVIGPSTYEGVEWGTAPCRGLIRHALSFAKQYFNVDENRVYVAGDSDGGRGTYAVIETEATFFAAAVPVIGSPGGVTRFLNLRNVPFFAINGEKDELFKIDQVRQAVDRMQASGVDLLFKVVEGGGHDPSFFTKFDEEVCAFLKEHPRDPYPKVVHWHVDPGREDEGGFPADTFRWIRIDETGSTTTAATFEDAEGHMIQGFPRVEAAWAGNRIEVKTQGVKRYTVLVSDEMLDLTHPIVVTTNGKESFQGLVVPDARAILEEARRFQDRELVFANRIPIAIE